MSNHKIGWYHGEIRSYEYGCFFIGGYMKKRIIVDLDGTVIPKVDFRESVIKCFERNGYEPKEKVINGFLQGMANYEQNHRNYQIKKYYEHLKAYAGIPFPIDLVKDYLAHIEELVPKSDVTVEREFLDRLYPDYEIVGLTNFFKEVQEKRLEYLSLLSYFTEVYGGYEYRKPDELAYTIALGNHSMNECVMIGDNYYLDFIRPLQLGLDAIWYHPEGNINNKEEVNELRMIKIER